MKLNSRHKKKTPEGFYLTSFILLAINEDGRLFISRYDKADEELILEAYQAFASVQNEKQQDRVEQIVCLGRILDKIYAEHYS